MKRAKWLAVLFVVDLYHGIWMTALPVKSTDFARTEQETPAQCCMVRVAEQRRQWGIEPSSHTYLNPKTEKASNFICEGKAGGTHWTGVRNKGQNIPHEMKTKWSRKL